VMITCLGHVTWLWSVHMGCALLRGQRSIRGSFPVKSPKIFKNSYLLCLISDEFKYKSCDLALVGAHVMVTDWVSKVIKGSFPVKV